MKWKKPKGVALKIRGRSTKGRRRENEVFPYFCTNTGCPKNSVFKEHITAIDWKIFPFPTTFSLSTIISP